MLMSPILPMMSMYRLPHGQYGYNSHVINLPQNITAFINSLPRSLTDQDIIVVRQQHTNQSSHHDFHVFSGITINTDNLALLPDDDSLIGIRTIMISSEESHNLDPTQEEETHMYSVRRDWRPRTYQRDVTLLS